MNSQSAAIVLRFFNCCHLHDDPDLLRQALMEKGNLKGLRKKIKANSNWHIHQYCTFPLANWPLRISCIESENS